MDKKLLAKKRIIMIGWFTVGVSVAFLLMLGMKNQEKGISNNMLGIAVISVLLGYISGVLFSVFFITICFANTTFRHSIIDKIEYIFYDKKFIEWEK